MAKLANDQHELFCQCYLKTLVIAKAGEEAGFTSRQWSTEVFHRDDVQERIAELNNARLERVQVNADYVLNRLVEIDQMDALDILNDDGSIKRLSEWPLIWRQFISGFDVSEEYDSQDGQKALSGYLKKIKWPDKTKNLELIGKHVAVGAFREKLELDVSDPVAELLKQISGNTLKPKG